MARFPKVDWLVMALVASILLLIFQVAPIAAQAWQEWPSPGHQTPARAVVSLESGHQVEIKYWLYLPEDYSRSRKWPLLLFLHGASQRGDDLDLARRDGPPKMIAAGKHFPMIVVSPQCRANVSWNSQELLALIDHLADEFSIDQRRIYAAGFSMGGFGAWRVAADAPERIAAIVPVAGGCDASLAEKLVDMPIWAFHGADDDVVPASESTEIVERIRSLGGDPKLTIIPKAGHGISADTFASDDIYDWMLRQAKSPSAFGAVAD